MTRKDFVLIAATIADLKLRTLDERLRVSQDFAQVLARTNDHFNRARFIAACMTEKDSE